MLSRARERLVHQHTDLVNSLRSIIYENGPIAPQGINHLSRIEGIDEAPNSDLPELVREECRELLNWISKISERIIKKNAKA